MSVFGPFSDEEEQLIQEAVDDYEERLRQEEIDAEIRYRIEFGDK